MNEWFYARGGQQSGPVTLDQLSELARGGGLDPEKDLVWNGSMPNWLPAGQVAGLFGAAAADSVPPPPPEAVSVGAEAVGTENPYAAPQTPISLPSAAPSSLGMGGEIVPGSDPIVPTECVRRGFDLTKRHFPTILLVGVVYFAISMALSMVMGAIQGVGEAGSIRFENGEVVQTPASPVMVGVSILLQIINQVVSIYLGLGLTRVALNLLSGAPVAVGQLFGEGDKLLRGIGGGILFGLMVVVGLVLLIVPGIYLALRYGQYMVALVDKNLPLMEAFRYSSSLTTNNRLNLFWLALLGMLITLAGLLACGVGLIFAGPVAWLSWIAAYRWMQYGRRAVQD